MELSQELVTKHNLTPEALNDIKAFGSDYIANEKKALEESFKGEANKNAEGILTGAALSVEKLTGIKRNDGEKVADYIARSGDGYLSAQKTQLDKLKSEYEAKIKDANGVDIAAIKSEYQAEKDALLQKYANYDELSEKASLADSLGKELSEMKLTNAFSSVKPNFPESVNPYEAKAKWDEFKNGLLDKYNIEFDENGVALYVDKENKFKNGKLEDLVKADKTIQSLVTGRQQNGIQTVITEIKGMPFQVDANRSIAEQIREYLNSKGLEVTGAKSKEYSKQFGELFKIYKQETANK